MTHWTDGPICAYDVEATGVDVETDRIVSFCVGLRRDGEWRTVGGVVNPGVDIPESATNVHGITNADAQLGMSPERALTAIETALHHAWSMGWPVVMYNAPYDATITDREMRRHLGRPFIIEGSVLDPLVLDRAVDTYRKGSRRLSDVAKHYGVELREEDAHSAAGDARAALELAVKLVRGGDANLFHDSLQELYVNQQTWYREQRLSFNAYLQRQGKTPDSDNLVWPMAPYSEGKVNDSP